MSNEKHNGTVSRRTLLGGLIGAGAMGVAACGGGTVNTLQSTLNEWSGRPQTDRMPAVFVGHGTPMSAINPNSWTSGWAELGRKLPVPATILCISAHWLTQGGALVTASEAPRMNYDMYGFPEEMYRIVYPAPGNVELARELSETLTPQLPVFGDTQWGFDHATWVVLKYMYPEAQIPVIQLSIDYSRPPEFHYELARHLQFLRSRGVLILGSGNFVHNLRMRPGTNNDQPYDWAVEFDQTMWNHIINGNHAAVADFLRLGNVAALAHPSYDHFLPVLYTLGVKMAGDEISTFSDNFQWPAVSMRSFILA